MEAHTRSPRELFEGKEHYEIPAFQRPYVWNEEDQWAPLWSDVTRVAETYVRARESDRDVEVDAHHFLGAVVYESMRPTAGDVTRHHVIDGQQRMTTIQLLLDAVQDVVVGLGHDDQAESLEELILNLSPRFKGKRERFKLWPSQADRKAFEEAMDRTGPAASDHQISKAHRFFRDEAERWIVGKPDEGGAVPPGSEELRVEALSSTLQDRLILVAIDLTGHDDAQLIFETLNDRGTPLLKADLIKNWLFRRGEQLKADVDGWAETRWAEFDSAWWREEIRQGRLMRSRIDIFVQYWLTMRRQDEVKAEDTFRVFVQYAEPLLSSAANAEQLVAELRRDADTYRSFAQLDISTAQGSFHKRVIEKLELAATTPAFLWLVSDNHAVPPKQVKAALRALESWAIRRTLLGLTTKDVNRFVVAILKLLDSADPSSVGDAMYAFLSEQTAETRVWPADARMTRDLPNRPLYGNVRRDRLWTVLAAIEQHLRAQDAKYEAVQLPSALQIEHVMPRGWRSHWDTDPKLNLEAAAERDRRVDTLGNLTLVTQSLNGSLSNRPWTDREAEVLGLMEGGRPGTGKRALLDQFSLLVLNKELLSGHPDEWTDADIEQRSVAMVEALCAIWPGPSLELQTAAVEAAAEPADDGLPELLWTDEDVRRLAGEVGEKLLTVLDTLSEEPGKRWSTSDFVAAGLTKWAFAALGALTMKVRGGFGRSNVPVIYTNHGGVWQWSVTTDFAAKWKKARSAGGSGEGPS
ncbi:DUF262 domain-containing protein [Actinopolymorpha pittospori]